MAGPPGRGANTPRGLRLLVRLVPLLSWHIKVRLPYLFVGAEANQMSNSICIHRPPHTFSTDTVNQYKVLPCSFGVL
jgi:hypothetical protein